MSNSLLYRAFIALDVFSGIASILHLLLISEVVRYWLARQAPSVIKAFLPVISIHSAVHHAWCGSYVCSREEPHTFSKISVVSVALLFHSLDIDLHHMHHDGDYREVSCARRQFLELSQGNETYSDNLLLSNSLRCCMGPIHDRKYHHVFLREMFIPSHVV